MTWHKKGVLEELKITCLSGLRVVHVYNAENVHVKANKGEDQIVKIGRVLENGYLGFVIQSDFSDSTMVTGELEFDGHFLVGKDKEPLSESFEVQLFRPALYLEDTPELVRVSFPSNKASPVVESKIKLGNNGRGSALLVAAPHKGSSLQFNDFFELEAGRKRYLSFISDRLDSLKRDYPSLSDILEEIKHFFNTMSEMDDEQILSSADEFMEILDTAFEEEPDFADDFQAVFFDAFLATFALDIKFQAWIQSLEATRSQRIILLNPWSSLKLEPGKTKMSLVFRYTDILGHEFPELVTTEFVVETNDNGLLPIYEILDFGPAEPKPPKTKSRSGRRRSKRQ